MWWRSDPVVERPSVNELAEPIQFGADLEIDDGNAVVTLRGELDVSSLPALRRVVVSALDFRPVELTLDMSAVTFLDPAGVGGLMSAAAMAAESGCRIGVRGASASATQVLLLLDVDDALHIERSTS